MVRKNILTLFKYNEFPVLPFSAHSQPAKHVDNCIFVLHFQLDNSKTNRTYYFRLLQENIYISENKLSIEFNVNLKKSFNGKITLDVYLKIKLTISVALDFSEPCFFLITSSSFSSSHSSIFSVSSSL